MLVHAADDNGSSGPEERKKDTTRCTIQLNNMNWSNYDSWIKTCFWFLQYALAQLAVIIIGLYIYIDAYPNEEGMAKHLQEGMNASIHDYGLDVPHGQKSITEVWDNLQESVSVKNDTYMMGNGLR